MTGLDVARTVDRGGRLSGTMRRGLCLHELETGLKAPTVDTARHLDQTLDAGRELARLVDVPIDHAAEAGSCGRELPPGHPPAC